MSILIEVMRNFSREGEADASLTGAQQLTEIPLG
uniref:Uncharacterized protein n=1 Tax=Rhizophora mucronata TaxID=61149 RepID=A0A2P2NQB4_RHIMU